MKYIKFYILIIITMVISVFNKIDFDKVSDSINQTSYKAAERVQAYAIITEQDSLFDITETIIDNCNESQNKQFRNDFDEFFKIFEADYLSNQFEKVVNIKY